ncbi:MAG: hypothetical protein DMG86_06180 [Acidobacteria bacterium]|nr:MAG: hypothetical protein DMG86_06180 [Acidobacteriota bacterium]
MRPIPQIGAINVFESAASSVYHGLTVSLRRRMTSGLYFRLAYTFGHAVDDGQDSLVAGRPVTVQNSYATSAERGPSVTAVPMIDFPEPDAFLGPDYAATDMRLTRRLYVHDRVKFDLVAESFNLLNRANQRVQFSDDGFLNTAGQFVQVDNQTGINHFPAQYRRPANFLRATDAYAPRQVQIALKLIF